MAGVGGRRSCRVGMPWTDGGWHSAPGGEAAGLAGDASGGQSPLCASGGRTVPWLLAGVTRGGETKLSLAARMNPGCWRHAG